MTLTGTNWTILYLVVKAIEMKMLSKFDVELLLGHISYKQKADIYNYGNSYEVEPKNAPLLEYRSINNLMKGILKAETLPYEYFIFKTI